MTFYDYQQSYQYCQSWAPTSTFEHEPCPQDLILKSQPLDGRDMSGQPVQRYLLEADHPYIHIDEDATLHPFSSVPVGSFSYVASPASIYGFPQQMPSPTQSGASSYVSSNWSDTDRTPHSSPDMCSVAYSPETAYTETALYGYGQHHQEDAKLDAGHCVALHDVQAYADSQTEFHDETAYASFIHEGYQPAPLNDCPDRDSSVELTHQCSHEQQRDLSVAPVIRRRRAQPIRALTAPHQPSKISKRSSIGKRTNSYNNSDKDNAGIEEDEKIAQPPQRSFACPFAPYGCTSTFGSKNEWKRHCQTQHMRLGFWRCDQCPLGGRKPNDFNRKDLFIQHVRRMHFTDTTTAAKTKSAASKKDDAEEQALAAASSRCYITLRSPPPRSGCLFCDEVFDGPNTWDERMEHVGRHLETKRKEGGTPIDPSSWKLDGITEAWLRNEGLIVRQGKRWILAEGRA